MGDLDLLVHRKDLERAVALAEDLGYTEDVVQSRLRPNLEVGWRHHAHLRNEQGTILELHQRLIGGADDWRSPNEAWVWLQAVPPMLGGRGAHTLNTPAHIAYISAHQALQHGLADARLIWFYDVYALLGRAALLNAHEQPDWEALASLAAQNEWSASLRATLSGVVACFDVPVRYSLLAASPKTPSRDETLVQRKAGDGLRRTERVWQVISSLRGSSKIKLVLAFLFPSPERMRYRYQPNPAWLWSLYYPYRWFDFLSDLTQTLVKKVGIGK